MSISDKLIKIAENEPKVYEAGKLAVLKDSKYMNASVIGSVFAVNDVNPIEHDVSVQLSNDTISDFSSVSVKQYWKNLLTYPYYDTTITKNGITFTDNGDGTVTINGTATVQTYFNVEAQARPIALQKGAKYTISGCPKDWESTDGFLMIRNTSYEQDVRETGGGASFTADYTNYYVRIYVNSGVTLDNVVFKPQLEIGEIKSDYERYVEPQTYQAEADGTVNGVKSVSPSMTLMTDTDGVTMDCSYLRDIDTYIDNLKMNVAMTGGE